MVYIVVFLIVTFVPIIIFLLYLTLTEYSPEKIEDSIKYKSSRNQDISNLFTISTYNIGHCVMDKKRLSESNKIKRTSQISREKTFDNLISITSETLALDSDFIVLQEVDHDSSRSDKINQIEYIYAEAYDYNAHFAYNFNTKYMPFPLNNPVGGTHSGLLSLSKYRPLSSKRYQLDGQEKYPRSMFFLKRCMLIEEFQLTKNKTLYIINVHISSYDKDKLFRTEQFIDMMDYVKKLYDPKKNYIVIGGDFNYLMDRRETNYPSWLEPFPDWLYESDFIPVFDSKAKTVMGSDGETHTIDGFIISKNVSVIDCKVIDHDFENSNHSPVKMTFKT